MTHTEPTIRETWNEQFKSIPFSSIASNEWYGTTTEEELVRRKQAKQEFLMDASLESPQIEYPKLTDAHAFDSTERNYQQLLNDAVTDEEYYKAARRLAELYRHKEVIRGIGRTGAKATLSQERAASMNEQIFGEVDRDAYLNLIVTLREQASELQDEMPEARELLAMLGDAKPEKNMQSPELTQETIDTLHQDLNELLPGLDDVIAVDMTREVIPADESKQKIEQLLDFLGLSEKGWKVRLIPDSNITAKTDDSTKTISIGEQRAHLEPLQLMKTSAHEAIGHANRAQGEVSLSSLSFEEAFAVCIEQIVTRQVRKGSGEQYYTALGLQYGYDQDGQRRGFRATHEILWRRNIVIARTKDETMTRQAAEALAYTQVYRTRRGNAIDTRDKSYFDGARVVPEWLNDLAEKPKEERQKILQWVLSDRFDPMNEEHVARHPIPS